MSQAQGRVPPGILASVVKRAETRFWPHKVRLRSHNGLLGLGMLSWLLLLIMCIGSADSGSTPHKSSLRCMPAFSPFIIRPGSLLLQSRRSGHQYACSLQAKRPSGSGRNGPDDKAKLHTAEVRLHGMTQGTVNATNMLPLTTRRRAGSAGPGVVDQSLSSCVNW